MRKSLVWVAAGVVLLAAGGGGYAWWRYTKPRVLTVFALSDYAFRRRPDWQKEIQARFDGVNRIYAKGTGVQWKLVETERADPTAQKLNLLDRRRDLEYMTDFHCDVLVSFTGAASRGGSLVVSPFSHALLVIDRPGSTELNTMTLARGLAHMFGAPSEKKGAGTAMTEPPEGPQFSRATIALIHALREYDFAHGIKGLDETWQRRAAAAIGDALAGQRPQPLAGGHEMVALALQNEGRAIDALAQIRSAVKLEPTNARLRLNLAAALRQAGDTDAALPEAREAIKMDPNNAEAHVLAGVLFAQTGDPEAAAAELERATQLKPGDVSLYGALGGLLISIPGGSDRAEQALSKAVELAPDSEVAGSALERVQAIKRTLATRLAESRAAAQKAPNDAAAHFTLGRVELAAGEFDNAAKEFARTTALVPKNGQAHFELARARFYQKDYAGAWDAIKAAQGVGYQPSQTFLNALKQRKPE